MDTGTVVRFRMGSQEYDQEIGLYHLGARYYDPSMGRFLSEDPSGIAGGLNLYAYASNDPVQGLDPSGLCDPPEVPDGNGGCTLDGGSLPGITVTADGSCSFAVQTSGVDCGTNERTCGYNLDPNCTPPQSSVTAMDAGSSQGQPATQIIAPRGPSCGVAIATAVASGLLDFATLTGAFAAMSLEARAELHTSHALGMAARGLWNGAARGAIGHLEYLGALMLGSSYEAELRGLARGEALAAGNSAVVNIGTQSGVSALRVLGDMTPIVGTGLAIYDAVKACHP